MVDTEVWPIGGCSSSSSSRSSSSSSSSSISECDFGREVI